MADGSSRTADKCAASGVDRYATWASTFNPSGEPDSCFKGKVASARFGRHGITGREQPVREQADWLTENAAWLGATYASEASRH